MMAFEKIRLPDKAPVSPERQSLFLVQTANNWIEEAKSMPVPKKLFSEFWYEGELCILFADTNLGKSILAVQIADAISRGQSMEGFAHEAERQKVLYLDFEMSAKQFENRYSADYSQHYRFDDFLLRLELDANYLSSDSFEDDLRVSIIETVQEHDARVLVIDNITYLTMQSTDTAREALPLMKMLKELKQAHGLSLLVLAHTPKRDGSRCITKNDLAGSRQLANFADSIFALGESYQDKSLRYLKQLKVRATEIRYDTEQVLVVEVSKPYNFLHFRYLGTGREVEHLRVPREGEAEELKGAIVRLKDEQPGLSNAEIARQLHTYPMKVKRVLDDHNST